MKTPSKIKKQKSLDTGGGLIDGANAETASVRAFRSRYFTFSGGFIKMFDSGRKNKS